MQLKSMLILITTLLLAACSPGAGEGVPEPTAVPDSNTDTVIISGEILTDAATGELPAGSTITIQVADTGRADAAAIVLGEQVIPDADSLPSGYAVEVIADELAAAVQSTISARIENSEGELIFINDTVHLVSASEPNVDVVVTAVAPAPESSQNALIDQTWQWVAFEDMASGAEDGSFTIDNPEQYTLTLLADGTYQVQADCNNAGGSYELAGSSLTLQPGPMTLAACGEESLSETFVNRLLNVATFVFDAEGNLVLNLAMDSGNLLFTRGG